MAEDLSPQPPFPVSEFRARTARLQQRMDQDGLDVLWLTSPADVYYTTGFLTRFWESPARPWFVLVPAQGAPVAVIPEIGAAPFTRSWLTDIRTWPAPDPDDDGVSLLCDTLAEFVPTSGCIGVPMGLETQLRMPLADYTRVIEALAPRRFTDATDAVQRVREIKSEAEIDRIRDTCCCAAAAFEHVPQIAQAGVPLSTVFRRFQAALLEAGADWVSYLAGAAGPEGYEDVISAATDRPLTPGDVLMLDTGAVRAGYFCDFDRNFSIGPASDPVKRAHAALHSATDAALAALRPGMRAADMHRILAEGVSAAGATPGGGRLGHGLGLTLTEWPSATPKDSTPLRNGMVLTLEPSAVVSKGRVLVHEENIVLRDDGPELLSPRAPALLPELPL
ncbi:MAG: Xaa-Pro peptidase family protein [Pseudomonadota bacterium]